MNIIKIIVCTFFIIFGFVDGVTATKNYRDKEYTKAIFNRLDSILDYAVAILLAYVL